MVFSVGSMSGREWIVFVDSSVLFCRSSTKNFVQWLHGLVVNSLTAASNSSI